MAVEKCPIWGPAVLKKLFESLNIGQGVEAVEGVKILRTSFMYCAWYWPRPPSVEKVPLFEKESGAALFPRPSVLFQCRHSLGSDTLT